jgi:hypothetical protein
VGVTGGWGLAGGQKNKHTPRNLHSREGVGQKYRKIVKQKERKTSNHTERKKVNAT